MKELVSCVDCIYQNDCERTFLMCCIDGKRRSDAEVTISIEFAKKEGEQAKESTKFTFTHNGVKYLYNRGWIYNERNQVLCMCDLSGTPYEKDKSVLLLFAKVALQARANGYIQGYNKRTDDMKRFLGL